MGMPSHPPYYSFRPQHTDYLVDGITLPSKLHFRIKKKKKSIHLNKNTLFDIAMHMFKFTIGKKYKIVRLLQLPRHLEEKKKLSICFNFLDIF